MGHIDDLSPEILGHILSLIPDKYDMRLSVTAYPEAPEIPSEGDIPIFVLATNVLQRLTSIEKY